MKNIVWISPFVPYDTVGHAGGKNHNYYIKYFQKKEEYNIFLITQCNWDEVNCIDLEAYQIKNDISVNPSSGVGLVMRILVNIESEWNPFNKSRNLLSNSRKLQFIKQIKRNRQVIERADIIIFQWAQAMIMLPLVKKYMDSNAKIIAIEEDVAFQGYYRKLLAQKTFLNKAIWRNKYEGLKKEELRLLQKCDTIVCLNRKDKFLLEDNGIQKEKIIVSSLYFDRYNDIEIQNSGYDILYYGAMNRMENETAVLWFIEYVMPRLPEQYRLIVLGGKPSKKIIGMTSERIIVTGFVKDIHTYLRNTLCMVVPLLYGAGIKAKVLEGFSAGKAVLTNEIGAEGMEIKNDEEFLLCKEPEEYAEKIQYLHNHPEEAVRIGVNARRFIMKNYDIDNSLAMLAIRMRQG